VTKELSEDGKSRGRTEGKGADLLRGGTYKVPFPTLTQRGRRVDEHLLAGLEEGARAEQRKDPSSPKVLGRPTRRELLQNE